MKMKNFKLLFFLFLIVFILLSNSLVMSLTIEASNTFIINSFDYASTDSNMPEIQNLEDITLRYLYEPIPADKNKEPLILILDLKNGFSRVYKGFIFRNAIITIHIYRKDNKLLIDFSVDFKNGLSANITQVGDTLRYVITDKNASFNYRSTYIIDQHNMFIYSPDGKWQGVLPYLARINPQKKELIIFHVDPSLLVCMFNKEYEPLFAKIADALNGTIDMKILKPGEPLKFQELKFIWGQEALGIVGCTNTGFYTLVTSPDVSIPDYNYKNLSIPGSFLIQASSTYSLAPFTSYNKSNDNTIQCRKISKEIILAYSSVPYPLAVLAVKTDIIPRILVDAFNKTGEFNGNIFIFCENLQLLQAFGGIDINAIYSIQGFLVEANLTNKIIDPNTIFLTPTFDTEIKYDYANKMLFMFNNTLKYIEYEIKTLNAIGAHVRLIYISSAPKPKVIYITNDYSFCLSLLVIVGVIITAYNIFTTLIYSKTKKLKKEPQDIVRGDKNEDFH